VRIPSTHPHRHSSSPSSCPSSSTRPPPSPVCTYPPPHSHPRRRCPVHAACPQLGTIREGMSRGLVSAVWSCNYVGGRTWAKELECACKERGWIARRCLLLEAFTLSSRVTRLGPSGIWAHDR
jgi:hypothetical protein